MSIKKDKHFKVQLFNHCIFTKLLNGRGKKIFFLFHNLHIVLSIFNYPITRQHILDSSKLKKFADDNLKFDKNGRKFSKRVENTVGKGEIARYEQFFLFPQCFQKACFPGGVKGCRCVTHYHTMPHFDVLETYSCRKHCQKKTIACNKQFLLFSQCFLPYMALIFHFNPFPNKPWIFSVCSTSLLKTLWEKEKLLVTSNFSFSHSVFYSFRELSAIVIKFKIIVCKLFQFGRV